MKKFQLYNNGQWRISAIRAANGVLCLFVESLKSGFCDYPIQYTTGQIAYDYPERIPQYVKRTVKSLLGPIRKDQWARLCDCHDLI